MNSVEKLEACFCPFGHLDLKTVCDIADSAWLHVYEAFEIIDGFKDSCGYESFDNVDPVYCVLDHILEQSRKLIHEESGYDFLNDYKWGGTEIYTHWNYMASSYDWSQDARDELAEIVRTMSDESKAWMSSNPICAYFLKEIDIELWE